MIDLAGGSDCSILHSERNGGISGLWEGIGGGVDGGGVGVIGTAGGTACPTWTRAIMNLEQITGLEQS
jgi:hypothetical protein